MTPEETNQQMTEAVGQVVGEVLVIVSHVVNALRLQPGFDALTFDTYLRSVAENADTSMLQKHAMEMLLNQQHSQN